MCSPGRTRATTVYRFPWTASCKAISWWVVRCLVRCRAAFIGHCFGEGLSLNWGLSLLVVLRVASILEPKIGVRALLIMG